jgi:cell division septation protein DedD
VLIFCLAACLADVALADGPYAVQVAAYRDAEAAAAEAERLQRQGYDAFCFYTHALKNMGFRVEPMTEFEAVPT